MAGTIHIWQELSQFSEYSASFASIVSNTLLELDVLNRYPKLNTDDFELSRYVHSLLQLSLEPVDSKATHSPFHTFANSYENPDFQLFYFSYSEDVVLDAVADNPHYWLAVPVSIQPLGPSHKHITLQRGSARLASPGSPDPLHLKGGAESLGLCLNDHTIKKYAEPYFGEYLNRSIVFDPRFDVSNTVDRTIGQMIAMLVEEEQIDASILHDSRCTGSFVESVVSTLLLYAPHSHSVLLETRNHAPAPRDVKRVIDYIQAYPHHVITLPLLVEIANVPGRTLNEHFRAFTGLSPMAYVNRTRLQCVRRELISGNAQSVTKVAIKFGFYHLGRFSKKYLKAFGELPSETLVANQRH